MRCVTDKSCASGDVRHNFFLVQSFIVGIKKVADRYMMPYHRTAGGGGGRDGEQGELAAAAEAGGDASVSAATQSALFE